MSTFEERRLSDPQGLIDDLVRQITDQAKAIYEKNLQLSAPAEDGISEIGKETIKGTAKPRSAKGGKKKGKKDESDLPLEDSTPQEES